MHAQTSVRGQSSSFWQGTRQRGSLTAALLSHTRPVSQVPVDDELPLPQSNDPTQGMPALPHWFLAEACQVKAP